MCCFLCFCLEPPSFLPFPTASLSLISNPPPLNIQIYGECEALSYHHVAPTHTNSTSFDLFPLLILNSSILHLIEERYTIKCIDIGAPKAEKIPDGDTRRSLMVIIVLYLDLFLSPHSEFSLFTTCEGLVCLTNRVSQSVTGIFKIDIRG